mmetsp:Transcript_3950/g.8448  ORF Transcript_3950/g.8448 Transcript_3950/m.8448 type:complete len:250 (+) Transcript_3950:402-1151(+)
MLVPDPKLALRICMSLIRSFTIPLRRLLKVLSNSFTIGVTVHAAKVVLCTDMTLVSSFAIPPHRLVVVLSNSCTIIVHSSKGVLCFGKVLTRSFTIPPHCLIGVSSKSLALTVHDSKGELRIGKAFIRSFTKPPCCLFIVLRDPPSFTVHEPKIEFCRLSGVLRVDSCAASRCFCDTQAIMRTNIDLVDYFTIPPHCLLVVFSCSMFSMQVHVTNVKLRIYMALVCRFVKPLDRFLVVLANSFTALLTN